MSSTPTTKGRLAFDLDDVILDFTGGVRGAVKREWGVEVPPFDTWDIAAVLNDIIGYSWWKWMRQRDWLWKTFPAVDGAIGTLSALRREGYYIEIVTHKPEWAEASVWQWLGRWRPPVEQVTIVGDGQSKADFSAATVLIDDKPQNCEEWAASGRPAVLFSRPHNLLARHDGGATSKELWNLIHRADSWADVRALVVNLCESY